MRLRLPIWTAAVAVFLLHGCGDDDDDIGVVVAEWSVDGRTDREICGALGADLFEVSFFDRDRVFVGEAEEPCSSFSVFLTLDEGTYDIATRLITVEQEAVSEELFFDDVIVDAEIDAVLHADFLTATTR